MQSNAANLRQFKTGKYKELLTTIQPGVTVGLMHCTATSDAFKHISTSSDTRLGDLLSMTDPDLRRFIEKENIILTTLKELQARRDNLNQ